MLSIVCSQHRFPCIFKHDVFFCVFRHTDSRPCHERIWSLLTQIWTHKIHEDVPVLLCPAYALLTHGMSFISIILIKANICRICFAKVNEPFILSGSTGERWKKTLCIIIIIIITATFISITISCWAIFLEVFLFCFEKTGRYEFKNK